MTDQQAQNITAFLELARTAIDNAELRIVGLTDGQRHGPTLVKIMADVAAAAHNLELVGGLVKAYAEMIAEDCNNGAPVDRVSTGTALVS